MSRGTRESSEESVSAFAYGAVTLFRQVFQHCSTSAPICNSSACSQRPTPNPTTPRAENTLRGYAVRGLG